MNKFLKIIITLVALSLLLAACAPKVETVVAPEPTKTVEPTQVVPTNAPEPTKTIEPTQVVPTKPPDPTAAAEPTMEMVYVPAGDFLMGSTQEEVDQGYEACTDRVCEGVWPGTAEVPQHTVYLDAFWIDKTEVTTAMFRQFIEQTGYQTDADKAGVSWVAVFVAQNWTYIGNVKGANWQYPLGHEKDKAIDNYPVVQVSWNDAKAYCEWAGRRLPTEAEWEKAARGTDGRMYPWGNQPPAGNLLNFADQNTDLSWSDKTIDDGYAHLAPVGSYPAGASPYGALDMAGNVWEWVADKYDPSYYRNSPREIPTGPDNGDTLGLRGGNWLSHPYTARPAFRIDGGADNRADTLGIRCALSASQDE